jgi:hypothetical protein
MIPVSGRMRLVHRPIVVGSDQTGAAGLSASYHVQRQGLQRSDRFQSQ